MQKIIRIATLAALGSVHFTVSATIATPSWTYWDTTSLVGQPEYGNAATQGNCSAVRLGAVTVGTSTTNLLQQSGGYDATKCMGFDGNEGPYQYDTNIGQYQDGLLNGEAHQGVSFFNGLEFIAPSELQILGPNGDLSRNDPGWIQLVNFNNDLSDPSYKTAGSGANQIDISELLNFSMTCLSGTIDSCTAGTWQLNTFDNIILDVKELLGESTFDHLAIVLKASNAIAVYDFNFNAIFANEFVQHNNVFSLNQNYNLSGTWDTTGLGVKKDGSAKHAISHMSVAARDPQDREVVSAPATIALFGMGLLMLSLRRRT